MECTHRLRNESRFHITQGHGEAWGTLLSADVEHLLLDRGARVLRHAGGKSELLPAKLALPFSGENGIVRLIEQFTSRYGGCSRRHGATAGPDQTGSAGDFVPRRQAGGLLEGGMAR